MAAVILLDTHVVVWLHAGLVERVPPALRPVLEREALRISPMVALELTYLHEVGRVAVDGASVLEDLGRRLGLAVQDASFAALASAARPLTWTRDPFDRLIAAHALVAQVPLATADRSIREHLDLAVWDD